jgi:hypothetical protein
MVMATIPYKSPLTLPCGITLGYLLYLFVGFYSKTLKVSFNPKHFCVQIHRLNPSKFCIGSATRWQLEVTFEEVRAHLGVETRAAMVSSIHSTNHTCSIQLILNCGDTSSSRANSASV